MSDLRPRSAVDQQTHLEAFGYRATVLDTCEDWKTDQPLSEWTPEDQVKEAELKAEEFLYWANVKRAMASVWQAEGVRCATGGRNPERNPYESIFDR